MSIATNDNLGSDFDRGKSGSGVIEVERKSDWDALNRAPFTFRHHLENHPLLAIPRLVNIAESAVEKRGPRNVYVPDDPELKNLPWKQRLPEAVRRIECDSLWLKISQLKEMHSDYRDLLKTILDQMEKISDWPLRRRVTEAGLTGVIPSLQFVT